jgi:hypothetical protein
VYPILPVFLDYSTQGEEKVQYRKTGNIGYTRRRKSTIQKNWQYRVHKAKKKYNTEKLAI